MAYDLSNLQSQLQNLSQQYQQLTQPQYQQPVILPQPQLQVPPKQVQYVEGLSGARIYQDGLQPNSSEIIMDKDDNVFYMVSKDANGTPSKKIPKGRFTIEEVESEEPAFLTRKDFEDFKDEIRKILSETQPQAPAQRVISSGAKTSTSK